MGELTAIDMLISNLDSWQIIDVRSPSEFDAGHIPGAVNIPLFSDDERAVVGTLYKQTSPESAMERGLEIAGSKMAAIVAQVKPYSDNLDKKIIIHCWRGGKRSKAVHWLVSFTGQEAFLLEGGYKAFRKALKAYFVNNNSEFRILGGCTGSGKTEVLWALADRGEQIIDLEKLANHKGSAFGGIGEQKQPTTEQFENNLFLEFLKLDRDKPIWVENESKSIGKVFLPDELWKKMRSSILYTIEVDEAIRLERAMKYYSDDVAIDVLKSSFERIKKRLGGLEFQNAIDALDQRDLKTAAAIALAYYDKSYNYQIGNWPGERIVQISPCNKVEDIAEKLINSTHIKANIVDVKI